MTKTRLLAVAVATMSLMLGAGTASAGSKVAPGDSTFTVYPSSLVGGTQYVTVTKQTYWKGVSSIDTCTKDSDPALHDFVCNGSNGTYVRDYVGGPWYVD